MATLEERFTALEGDYATVIRAVAVKLDEHAAAQRGQGRDIREIKARLAVVDTRLNGLDEKVDTLSEDMSSLKADVGSLKSEVGAIRAEMNRKFDQILALLAPGTPGA